MKKLFILVLTLLFAILCVGCSSESADITPTDNVPDTLIDPATVDFGYDEEKDEYDRWYLQGSDDVIYLYFSLDENDDITYNIVKSGVVKESGIVTVNSDDHLVSENTDEKKVDFGFEDNFNVYNYESKELYSRGNADEYNATFKNRTFTNESKSCKITFNSDFTCTKADDKNTNTGTWEIKSKSKISCTFDNKNIDYKIEYNDDFFATSITHEDEVLYNIISEDETVNKYKAY